MPSQEDIAGQQEVLAAHRRTLSIYLRQLAITGIPHAPPAVLNGIQDSQKNIADIKNTLRRWGINVEDHPDDEALHDIPIPATNFTQAVLSNQREKDCRDKIEKLLLENNFQLYNSAPF